jgi:hypothetical protein
VWIGCELIFLGFGLPMHESNQSVCVFYTLDAICAVGASCNPISINGLMAFVSLQSCSCKRICCTIIFNPFVWTRTAALMIRSMGFILSFSKGAYLDIYITYAG